MRTLHSHGLSRIGAWAALAALAACNHAGSDEMSWARSALERNDGLEIVAEDRDARTFTVRVRDSNQLKVVRVDELSAAVPDVSARSGQTPPVPPSTAAETAPSADPGEPTSEASPAPQDGPAEEARAAQAADAPPEPVAATGTGRVIASGPGYSIQASDRPSADAARVTEAAGATERRTEPLVCQGARFMHIDGRSIAFTGDAVVAEEGCELFITNSRITAGGVGVAVRGASVHIKNSTVTGQTGAIHASGNAQIYAQSSRFRGMVRRLDDAVLHDMGENVWN